MCKSESLQQNLIKQLHFVKQYFSVYFKLTIQSSVLGITVNCMAELFSILNALSQNGYQMI